jgi:hypothetical protein
LESRRERGFPHFHSDGCCFVEIYKMQKPSKTASFYRFSCRTEIPIAEWERVFQKEAQARRLLYQARVLGLGQREEALLRSEVFLTNHAWKPAITSA